MQNGEKNSCIGLCARVRLNIGIFCIEEFADTFDGKVFRLVNYCTTTIVTLAGVTLCILVGHVATHRFHHLIAHEVFRSDKFDAAHLSLTFGFDQVKEKVPVIVWLHGGGDNSTDLTQVETRGLPYAIANWELEGFNAYVVAPQHMGPLIKYYWATEHTRNLVIQAVIDAGNGRNFDPDKIVIAGHSIGGMGAVHYGGTFPEFWSAAVPISAVDAYPYENGFKDLPVCAYLADHDGGGTMWDYFHNHLKQAATKTVYIQSSHAMSGAVAFMLDENGDGKSDLIEWALSQNRLDRIAPDEFVKDAE